MITFFYLFIAVQIKGENILLLHFLRDFLSVCTAVLKMFQLKIIVNKNWNSYELFYNIFIDNFLIFFFVFLLR